MLPTAKANASSVYDAGKLPIHQIAHLNDGWYGNDASWIAGKMPAWAEIDLGAEHEIYEIRLSNDRLGQFGDRGTTDLQILAATKYDADSARCRMASASPSITASRLLKEEGHCFPADDRPLGAGRSSENGQRRCAAAG